MAIIKKSTTIIAGEGVEKKEPSYTVGGNANFVQPYEQYGGSFKKLKIELPYDPELPLLDIYLEKTIIQKDMHPNVHCSTIYNRQDMEAT